MDLFPNILLGEPAQQRLAIDTPLGTVRSLVTADDTHATSGNAAAMHALQAGGVGARWEFPCCNVEVLLCRPVPIANVREYQLDGYWAWLWRVQALEQINSLQFACTIMPYDVSVTGGADSGEHLDAQTWDDGATSLTLGTEDGDALAARASRNEWMPRHYLKQADPDFGLPFVAYTVYGLDVNVGAVEAGEQVQIQFIVAWAPYHKDTAESWFAADVDPTQIIYRAHGYTAHSGWPRHKPIK